MKSSASLGVGIDSVVSFCGNPEGFASAFFVALVVAFLEAFFVTTLLVPGCLLTVGLGVLMASGQTHPIGCVGGVVVGMWVGDQVSYFMARGGRVGMGRSRIAKGIFERLEYVGRAPARTLLLAHLCPYLSGLVPAAAGSARVAYPRFLVYDSMGVMLGSVWFLSVGAGIGASSRNFADGLVIGVGVSVLVVVFVSITFRAFKVSLRRRGLAYILVSLSEYPVFLLHSISYRFLPASERRVLQLERDRLVAAAKPCDILLVRRNIRGPWGKTSHAAIVEGNGVVIHAFHKVQRQLVSELPLRDGFKLVRVKLSAAQRAAILQYARRQVGKKFKIATTIQEVLCCDPPHFSCATLVWASFREADLDLAEHVPYAGRWIFPRDFQSSPLTFEVEPPTTANEPNGNTASECLRCLGRVAESRPRFTEERRSR